jgi:hypothetical protein
MCSADFKTCTNLIKNTMSKIPEIFDKDGKALHIGAVITPFWLWLVREAKIEVIDAENFIEVHGFAKEADNLIPVISFAELLEWYKSQNEL